MKQYLIIVLLFIIGLLLEGIITTVPLVTVLLLVFYAIFRKKWVYPAAIILGIGLDFFAMRQIGISSAFFVLFLFLIIVYEQKFEIATIPFLMFASFFGSFAFLMLIDHKPFFLQAGASSFLTLILYKAMKVTVKESI